MTSSSDTRPVHVGHNGGPVSHVAKHIIIEQKHLIKDDRASTDTADNANSIGITPLPHFLSITLSVCFLIVNTQNAGLWLVN